MNFAEMQRANGRFRANQPAVVDERGTLTHSELDERARRTAALMARRGVKRGDLVGVCLRDDARTIVACLALSRLGAVFFPLDWRWTPEEQGQINRALQPRLVLVEPDRRIDTSLPAIPHDTEWERAVDAMPAEERMASGGSNALTMSMSSGTTGMPKGKVHTHETYHSLMMVHWAGKEPSARDRLLALLPMATAAGRYFAFATVLGGGTVFFPPALLDAPELLAIIRRENIDTLCVVPTTLRKILELAHDSEMLLPQLRKLISIGDMLFPEESRAVRARVSPNFINYYGSAGAGINTMLLPHEIDLKPGSVGRPAIGNEIEIVDDDDRMLPAGETGRLRIRAPQICRGSYPPDPDDPSYFEGWHYPGDYALIDEDGYLFLQGRYNDIIIRGGSNVYAPEVERALLTLDGVREAAVIGTPNATLGEDIAAFIVADGSIDDRTVIRHCRNRLATYKVPSILRRLESLPRNSAGKILKRQLLEMYESED